MVIAELGMNEIEGLTVNFEGTSFTGLLIGSDECFDTEGFFYFFVTSNR